MITAMRKKLIEGGLGYKIVMWVILFSFILPNFLSLIPNLVKRFEQGPAIITIDGNQLENRTVEHAVQKQLSYIARMRQQLGGMADQYIAMLGLSNPVNRAIEEVVINHLLDAQAQNLSVSVGGAFLEQKMHDPYILQDVMSLSIFDGQGGLNAQALAYELQRMGKTAADFERTVQELLQRKLLIGLVRSGAYVSSDNVKRMFIQEHQAKKYDIIQFSVDAYKKGITVTDEQVETYFNDQTGRTKRYDVPEKRSGIVWQFPLSSYGVTVSDEAVERYYNKHKHEQFVDQPAMIQIRKIVLTTNDDNREAMRTLAGELQKQLAENPSAFAELAKKHSSDTSSAKDGGLTPYFKRGEEDAEVEKAAFLLEKDGGIAPLVTTKDGYVLVQRVGRKNKIFAPLTSVQKKIRETITERKFGEQFGADSARLLGSISESTDAFEAFARQKGAVRTEQPAISQTDTTVGRALFQLKKGNATAYAEAGRGYVVQLTSVVKAHTPSFKSVQDQVRADLIEEKARDRMVSDVKKAFEQSATEKLDTVAKEFGASYITTDMIKKDDSLKLSELTKKDVPVSALFELTKVGERVHGADSKHGHIIRVQAVDSLDEDLYQEKYQDLYAQAFRLEKDRVLKGFVASLQRRATIKVDTSGLIQ
jgi:parvulin-like peptidyl-prolyl isomerase